MRTRGIVSIAVLLLLGPAAAAAQTLDTELTGFGGYRFGGTVDVKDSDSAYGLDDASSFGLIWNHRYRANTQWEVFYSTQEARAELEGDAELAATADVETHVLQVGGTYLWDGASLQPYLAATLGATRIRARAAGSDSDTFVSASIGLGFRVAPTARLGLRFEARAHGTFIRENSSIFCSTGPDENVCAIKAEGNLFGQLEAYAGVSLRF
jgi:hypothetical protein